MSRYQLFDHDKLPTITYDDLKDAIEFAKQQIDTSIKLMEGASIFDELNRTYQQLNDGKLRATFGPARVSARVLCELLEQTGHLLLDNERAINSAKKAHTPTEGRVELLRDIRGLLVTLRNGLDHHLPRHIQLVNLPLRREPYEPPGGNPAEEKGPRERAKSAAP